jgi:hypothetical protein
MRNFDNSGHIPGSSIYQSRTTRNDNDGNDVITTTNFANSSRQYPVLPSCCGTRHQHSSNSVRRHVMALLCMKKGGSRMETLIFRIAVIIIVIILDHVQQK